MNYPVWNVPLLGSGLVVAVIAIIHVLISHFAVGGGLFLVLAELWAARSPDRERIRAWLHRFATFFLVFTTVFGALTGVGIWFAISLANPEATSLLIHQFVFIWATEWVAFLAELTVLYLYYYGWQTNPARRQLVLAVLYFVIAWLSLVLINGILTFMLTPGGWTLANRDLARAFFNPGYLPTLLIRTVVMFVLGGLGALVVAARIRGDDDLKARVVRFAARFVVPGAVLGPVLVYWFWTRLPASAVKLYAGGITGVAAGRMEAMTRSFWLSVIAGALVLVGTFVVALRPRALTTGAAVALLATALLGVLGGEFFREMARKPYVVHGVLYVNGLWQDPAKAPARLDAGYLDQARFSPTEERGTLVHGEWVYRLQCAPCHTLGGYRSLRQRTAAWTPAFGERFLRTLDSQGVMPPFQGNALDREALVAFLLAQRGDAISPADVHAAVLAEPEVK